jgi:hypothetical protein
MRCRESSDGTHDREREHVTADSEQRRPYVAPTLERLGSWSVLTLQQSVPISVFHDGMTQHGESIG